LSTDDADAALQRAQNLLELGRPVQAEEQFRALLTSNPESAPALQGLVRALIAQGRNHEAVPVAQAAVRVDPEDVWGHLLLSIAWIGTGEAGQALAPAHAAVRMAPHLWQTHYALGQATRAMRGRRSSREALVMAREAARLAPHEPDPHVLVASCLWDLGRNREARRANAEALRLDPTHTMAISNLAATRIAEGRLSDAGAMVTSGLGVDPQMTRLHDHYDRVLGRVVNRLAYAGLVLSAILTAMAIQEVSYPLRSGTAVAGIALCCLGVWSVIRRLPRGSGGWARGLIRRSGLFVRVMVVILAIVAAITLCLGFASASGALALALEYRAFLATYSFFLLVIAMRTVVGALSNRI
jgi:Flp pilus assembly protein TadD